MFIAVVAAVVLILCLAFVAWRRKNNKRYDLGLLGMVGLLFTVLAVILVQAVASAVAPKHEETKWKDPVLSLVSLQDPSSKGGDNIYLFVTEESDGATHYTYWYKEAKGFKQGQLSDADNVVVVKDCENYCFWELIE